MEVVVFLIIGGIIGLIIRMSMNAGKSNAPVEMSYPFSKATLEDAVQEAAKSLNYTVVDVDQISGRIEIEVGLSMSTFGEVMTVQLIPSPDCSTRVVMSCRAKYGRENLSKNAKNIHTFSSALSAVLAGKPQETIAPSQSTNSVAEELTKLKQLLDCGALTQTEFDTQKAKLLS